MANDKDFIVKNAVEVGKDTKVTLGSITSDVLQEGYSLTNTAYDSVSLSVTSQIGTPTGIFFKPDGTKIFIVDLTNNDISEYSLSTAWDLTTASYVTAFSISSQDTSPWGIFFKSDGTVLYLIGRTNDTVFQYTLSTAWDISTASYASKSFSVASQDTVPNGLFFKSDGTKMYVAGNGNDNIYQYTLSTAYDVSTASYDSVSIDISGQTPAPGGLVFHPDGGYFYLTGSGSVFKYSLSTAWDLSTATYSSVTADLTGTQDTSTYNLAFKSDGTKMYVVSGNADTIYQYSTASYAEQINLDTGNYFNDTLTANTTYTFSNAGAVQSFQLEVTGGAIGYDLSASAYDSKSFSVTSQETTPKGIAFKTDGTKVYIVGNTSDTIYQYSLSTAWDISTASYDSVSFSTSGQEGYPTSLVFKSDGLKMFLMGQGNARVYSYTLSTAWDVSTASYDSVFLTVTTQVTTPRGLSLKSDGTVMVIGDNADNGIHQYTLSTGWDLSTASYASKTFTPSGFSTYKHLFVNPDGTKMYLLDTGTNEVVKEFSLSTAWDISTASSTGNSLDVTAQDGTMDGMVFKPDGTKLYMLGDTGDNIYQYSTAATATLTWPTSIEWAGSVAPAAPANGETDLFTISTDDSGTTYHGFKTADNLS